MSDDRRTDRARAPRRDRAVAETAAVTAADTVINCVTNRGSNGGINGHGSGRDHTDEVTAAALDVTDPLVVMRRIAAQALVLVPAADGAVVELAGGDTLTYVCAAGTLRDRVGTRLAHAGSLSGLAMRTGQMQVCANSAIDDRVDRVACRRLGIVSMVCVPLARAGANVGVLKLSSRTPAAFDAEAVALLARLARFIADAIAGWSEMAVSAAAALAADTSPPAPRSRPVATDPSARLLGGDSRTENSDGVDGADACERVSMFVANVMRPGVGADSDARRRVRRLVETAGLVTHLQPIVDLKTGRVAGCEALSRFPDGAGRSPETWFADAERTGLGPELELAAVRAALAHLPRLPESTYLAVNVGHRLAPSPVLRDLIARAGGRRIVIELTEHLHVDDYPRLIAALDRLRATGARLAIDDTGAGFAGFSHILKLAPDLIKLDRILTTGIDTDPARQALAGALVNFACATGAKVIAEGIETADELAVVRDLGIDYGQGFHLARPAPPADIINRIAQPHEPQQSRVPVRRRPAR